MFSFSNGNSFDRPNIELADFCCDLELMYFKLLNPYGKLHDR